MSSADPQVIAAWGVGYSRLDGLGSSDKKYGLYELMICVLL
jgi:hypothetical protein